MTKTIGNGRQRTNRLSAHPGHREVAFILSSPEAEEVYLCGDFNEWVPNGLPMIRHADYHWWEKRLVLAPGRYEYKFIVNGVWIHNPNAPENVPNAFGSLNSVMEVQPCTHNSVVSRSKLVTSRLSRGDPPVAPGHKAGPAPKRPPN